MYPGMNSRQMKQAMKKMGIAQQDIDAKEVIIRLEDKEIVIHNPSVTKVNMMGQETYQITGEETERSLDTAPSIDKDDIETVMEQADVDEETAINAIKDANGDLAQAILYLKK